jgi:hypothetical protein
VPFFRLGTTSRYSYRNLQQLRFASEIQIEISISTQKEHLSVSSQPIGYQSGQVNKSQAIRFESGFGTDARELVLKTPVAFEDLTAAGEAFTFRCCLQPVS